MKVLLFDISIDVLAINETRLDSTISDNEMHVPGYEIVRRDRNVNGRTGGGVFFMFVATWISRHVSTYLSTKLRIYALSSRTEMQAFPRRNVV